jgi:2-phosphosulfolactate phosphatase
MQITTSVLPTVSDSNNTADVAVVIDVLRATSVMATAVNWGARQIITCRDVNQAVEIASETEPPVLLCGERECVLIPGFHLGNSPSEYRNSVIGGKTLILTTTNGTAAIETATSARDVIAASFLNISAVVESIAKAATVRLICAGTDGFISNEDILLAGAIISDCQSRYGSIIDGDSSTLALQLWRSFFPGCDRPTVKRLADVLRETRGGRNLIRVGFQRDIELCSQIDSLTVTPRLQDRQPMTFL